MVNPTDIDFLLTSSATEAEIIEAVVDCYRAGIYRLACSMLQDPDEAEDCLQETFIRAAGSLGHYQPGTNFKGWLYAIAVNTCRGALRKRKARSTIERLLGRQQSLASTLAAEETLIHEEQVDRLRSLVAVLDERHRLVVVLRYDHNLSIAEIAQALSIPQKTVYNRLYTAFARLREQLDPPDGPGEG